MSTKSKLIKNTEQCVMCGLCLPHCPTYQVSQHEGESPRGRISLIKAYAQGQLNASTAIQTHLQSCTACMKCEQVCPANVPYHSILDAGRSLYRDKLKFTTRNLQAITIYLLTRRWGHRLLSLLRIGATRLFRFKWFSQFQAVQLAQALGQQDIPFTHCINHQTEKSVTIFPGCTADVFDRETLYSTIQVVSAVGYQAKLPKNILCCSALAQHSGLLDLANQQRRRTIENLPTENTQELISFASGCGQQLDSEQSEISYRHRDIHAWLNDENRLQKLNIRPLHKIVLVHIPCSMQSNAHNAQAMLNMLQAIPDITLQHFENKFACCGAGGMQLLTPEKSNLALVQAMIDFIQRSAVDIIVSANIGCALQLRKGLLQIGLDIEVLHPVALLQRQIES